MFITLVNDTTFWLFSGGFLRHGRLDPLCVHLWSVPFQFSSHPYFFSRFVCPLAMGLSVVPHRIFLFQQKKKKQTTQQFWRTPQFPIHPLHSLRLDADADSTILSRRILHPGKGFLNSCNKISRFKINKKVYTLKQKKKEEQVVRETCSCCLHSSCYRVPKTSGDILQRYNRLSHRPCSEVPLEKERKKKRKLTYARDKKGGISHHGLLGFVERILFFFFFKNL